MSTSKANYVDHTYRDFSRFIDDGGQLIQHKKSEANFPAKLHKMLSEPRHSQIITWMPHGRAFKIIDKDALFGSVLPQYYLCSKYESFTRQLNAWGFKRLYQSGPDLGCHYHECFLRGLPKLTCFIRRLLPSQGKATPYPAGEPNLYTISAEFPLSSSALSNASVRSPVAYVDTEVAADAKVSTLDPPPHDQSQSEIMHPSSSSMQTSTQGYSSGLQSAPSVCTSSWEHPYEPSNQESIAALASAAVGDASSRRGPSTEVQYPPFPFPQEYMTAFAASARMTNESPHRMSPYTHDYQYPPAPAQSSYSHITSNPTKYTLPLGHSSQHYNSSYGQHATQGQTPHYQYQTPQYTCQHQSHKRPRFWYPPPQLPQHLNVAPGSFAPVGGHLPQGSYHHYHGSNLNTGQSLPPSPRIHGSHEGDAISFEWPSGDVTDTGLATNLLQTLNKIRKLDPPQ